MDPSAIVVGRGLPGRKSFLSPTEAGLLLARSSGLNIFLGS